MSRLWRSMDWTTQYVMLKIHLAHAIGNIVKVCSSGALGHSCRCISIMTSSSAAPASGATADSAAVASDVAQMPATMASAVSPTAAGMVAGGTPVATNTVMRLARCKQPPMNCLLDSTLQALLSASCGAKSPRTWVLAKFALKLRPNSIIQWGDDPRKSCRAHMVCV